MKTRVHDLIRGRSVVWCAGRRYTCGPPTFATVWLFLDHFGDAVRAMLRHGMTDSQQWEILLELAKSERFAAVLATCVEGDPLPDASGERAGLARECLSLCDLPRLVETLHLKPLDGDEPAELDVGPHEIAICSLAETFGCAPHDVTAWPYMTYCAALATLTEMRKTAAEAEPPSVDFADLTADNAPAGFGFQ